ncbi:sensor histidine kinase [Cribrihabitans neustonicus]|uniref:sensor histidine kinase n=1 Tax=Cribrihabitans neustonicus TaxID=1429085 RepID=UPI003B59D392
MIQFRRSFAGSLLVRLAGLMTLALLPLGLIAIYQTNAVVTEASRLSHASLLDRTQRAAARERELLQRAGGVTEGLAALILPFTGDQEACSEFLRAFTEKANPFTFAAFIGPDGQMNCTSTGVTRDVSQEWSFLKAQTVDGPSFAVDDNISGSSTPQLLATSPVRQSGTVAGYVSIGVPHRMASTMPGQPGAASGIQFSTVDSQGDILFSSAPPEEANLTLPSSVPRRELLDRTGETFFGDSHSGNPRFFAVSAIIPGQVAVVGSWPVEKAMSMTGNPASLMTMAFPVLMWLAGITVAVFGLQRSVIRHLSALRTAMRRYALGEREDPRLELSHPPREFEEAQQSFNRMVTILSEAERRREQDLAEKTVLLREVHHRVKNNLQMIASIMNMQSRSAHSMEARSMLSQLQRRVRGLATIHRSLNTNPDVTTVDSRQLLNGLVDEIGSINPSHGPGVEIGRDVIEAHLSQDQAVTLSMLFSEAMTNAVKYAGKPKNGPARITVSLHLAEEGTLELEICNTKGERVFETPDDEMGTGVGTRLMQAFTTQLDGVASILDNEDYYCYQLRFPAPPGTEAPITASQPGQGENASEPAA